MKYGVVTAGTIADLKAIVECDISRGWVPQGGISSYSAQINSNWSEPRFMQAMVKKEAG